MLNSNLLHHYYLHYFLLLLPNHNWGHWMAVLEKK
jgi:hypothetical protein